MQSATNIRANALQLYQTHAQANGDFGDPPTWQFLTGSRWSNFDDSVSAQLELAFATSNQKHVSLIFLNAEHPGDAPTVNLRTGTCVLYSIIFMKISYFRISCVVHL